MRRDSIVGQFQRPAKAYGYSHGIKINTSALLRTQVRLHLGGSTTTKVGYYYLDHIDYSSLSPSYWVLNMATWNARGLV